MKIGLDASFAINDASGVGRYSFNLIKNLLEIDRENNYILFFNYFRSRSEKEKRISQLIGDSKNVKIIKNHLLGKFKDKIWENPIIAPDKLYFGQLDLYHALCFQAYPRKLNAKKSLVTIHDLTYLIDPNFHQKLSDYYQKVTANAINKANIIIADSNSTKDDIIKYFQTKPDQINTIYLGVDDKFKPASTKNILEFKKKYAQGSEYILSVGTVEPRKNLPRLIQAYQKLPPVIQDKYKLLIVGKSGWERPMNAECRMQNVEFKKNNILFTGFISDNELIAAYSGTSAFVYPSLYEGFGFPALEAMACGAPVITSNISSLPEVVGNAAIYFDPQTSADIADKIHQMLINADLRKKMVKKGFEQSSKFTWVKTAQQTLEQYNKILISKF